MTDSMERSRNYRSLKVPDFDSQFTLLNNHGADIRWGEKGKGYISFLRELFIGESRLRLLDHDQALKIGYQEGLLRESNISCIYVFHRPINKRRLQLFESLQIFSSGLEVRRGFGWVTEKGLFGESPFDTALRALGEELGLNKNNAVDSSKLQLLRQIIKNDTADTYPGLQSRMTATDFEIALNDEEYTSNMIYLPDGRKVHGFKEIQKDKTTYFEWREVE